MKLLKGTLDVLVLKALAAAPLHGYGVSAWIRERTQGTLGVEDAALYQALHRLERQKLVASEWGASENNRRARFYRLTAKGSRRLAAEDEQWRRYAEAVFRVLDARA